MIRLAVVVSHPIQYYAPIFRELARRVDLHVFFAQSLSPAQQAAAGFGQAFDWDVDLLSGYPSTFLKNVAARPGPDHFLGCDTPEIGARLKRGGFDALLVFGWYLKSMVQAVWAAKSLGIPVIVRGDSHLDTPRGPLKRAAKAAAYPLMLRAFDAALYVGARSRAYYEHYHYPPSRLFFSPHCVDAAWFAARATPDRGRALRSRLGIAAQEKVVLFAGKLIPLKRPLDIVDACASADGAGPHLVVAGAGELEAAVRQRAAAMGVRLHLLGFQNQTEMPAVYAAADVLVLASDRETWGLVANEALACGVPIIVSDTVGCAPDLAGDGAAGRIFPLGDTSALARAIGEVLHSPPSPEGIAAKSSAYTLGVALEGVERALAAVAEFSLPRIGDA
jgi:glycosyltransferase involved in cell wall biosynthesis